MIKVDNKLHQANMLRWDASSDNWAACADSRGIWQKCHQDPSLVFSEKALQQFKDIAGQKVCVLGSGDNEAVFALAGLGAQVTSVDISAKQLEVAAQRAKQLGLKITFLQSDVTSLQAIEDDAFDLVYTGGHVAVWVADLKSYYAEAVRILAPGGLFMVDEYHPFRRIWQESKTTLKIGMSYFDQGPFRYLLNNDVLYKSEGQFESFEFHWTMSDYLNAIIQAGCRILEMEEYGEACEDWEGAPMKGLPEIFLVIARKD